MRVTVPRPPSRHRRRRDDRAPLKDPFHASEVLGGFVDLPALPEEDRDLGARIPFEMDVGGRPDVVAPAVLRRGQSGQDVRRLVPVEEGDDPERIGLRVGERPVRQFLADERPDRVGTARAIAFLHPPVEEREQLRLERDAEAHDLDAHGSVAAGGTLRSGEDAGGVDTGPNPMSS